MRPCPACRGTGRVYVTVRSAAELFVRPVRLAAARVLAIVLTLVG
jgi:hypothetical protein